MPKHIAQQAPDQASKRPTAREPLSDEAVESSAAWLRLVAVPTRIRLIEILNAGSSTVQGLAARLGTTYQNASKHLGVLHEAGIVSRSMVEGRIHYDLIDWAGWWLVEQVARSVTAGHEDERGVALRNASTV
jgi:DNA-binding transcriptional ArsR family regulator